MTTLIASTETSPELESRVVVGIDGSPCARRALDFAIDEAGRRGALLHLVCAYDVPAYSNTGWIVVPIEAFKSAAEDDMALALDHVRATAPSLVTKGEVLHGRPGPLLVEASKDAALLVVGSRGRGEVASLLLGSASMYCAHHTSGPITIVHCR